MSSNERQLVEQAMSALGSQLRRTLPTELLTMIDLITAAAVESLASAVVDFPDPVPDIAAAELLMAVQLIDGTRSTAEGSVIPATGIPDSALGEGRN